MKPELTKAILGGVAGTLVMTMMMLVAPMMTGMPMDIAGFLMSNIGGMMAVMAALMGHLVYGGLLGAITGSGQKTPIHI